MMEPIQPSVYVLSTYQPCQVWFVVAKELRREHGMPWDSAYAEGRRFHEAIVQGGRPLSPGARAGEIHWPTMICTANRYASRDKAGRDDALAALAAGAVPWALAASFEQPDMCDPAILSDPEYQDEPSCMPEKTANAAWIGLGAFAVTLGLVWIIRR